MHSQPIDFHPPAEEAAPILLPVTTTLFADRAARFNALADQHSLADWLLFLGDLSQAQHEVLKGLPTIALPDAAALEQSRTHGMPPLNAASLARPAAWRFALQQIVQRLEADAPEGAQATLKKIFAASETEHEQLADMLLKGEPDMAHAAELPFVAAALQVVFTQMASQLDARHLQKLDAHGVCPCCGSLPVASVVRLGATINNLRYLHCSLCNTEWNVPRATCTTCDTDKEVSLHEIEGSKGAVRAETCDACKSYLKIVYQEKDPNVDPVADDLATLPLDMLVDEAGYERSGPNLLLIGAHSG
ncbi:MAG: formate dehydrogenase accessory protein FdhE, partial [Dechloromonas sp.]|jgi:FdhE protein|nr:formate dehydrogenase accessory protein FdhE [Dechloromonas sp.]